MKDAFDEINQIRMLWTVQPLWPSGTSFVFKCYPHHLSLDLRRDYGTANIIHNRKGVTQVDLLAIVAYGIVILPKIKQLKSMYPDVTQPWYTDDSGALGTFNHLQKYFKALNHNGPERGYLPNPT